MDAKKKATLAVVLVAVWASLAFWQWEVLKAPVRVPLTNVSGPASTAQLTKVKAKTSGFHVNLELLALARTQREATFITPRNIFAAPSAGGTVPTVIDAPQPQAFAPVPGEAVVRQAEVVDVSQYRYLGFLRIGASQKKNKNIAVLTKDEEVLAVKAGDRVEGNLVLKTITEEHVVIRDTGARTEQTVPLSEEPVAKP
jgi:hypothetical protein